MSVEQVERAGNDCWLSGSCTREQALDEVSSSLMVLTADEPNSPPMVKMTVLMVFVLSKGTRVNALQKTASCRASL